ncbi:hypothetical protein D5086_010798 [Populus alba]|uniref:Uncharacterized protein n=1 Tax=Populus alba TaxID=43335 RepID=A0ACC4CBX7_POPAL
MVAASHCALAVAPLAYASCARKRCYVEMWVLVGIVLMIPLVELCNHCLFLLKAFVNIRANVIGWKEVLGLSNLCLRNDLKRGVWSWSEGINYAPALAAATVGIVLAQRATATAIAVACVLTAKGCHTWTLQLKLSPLVAQVCVHFCSFEIASLSTLRTCLDSTRALSDPKWSWREDLQQVVKSRVMLMVTDDTSSSTMESAPLRLTRRIALVTLWSLEIPNGEHGFCNFMLGIHN